MSVKTNRKSASTPTDEPELTAVDPTTDETSTIPVRRRGRSGPKGPALIWNTERQRALGKLMIRISKNKIPGPLTTPVVSAYITGARPIPEGHDDLAELMENFRGVEDLVTGAKLISARNKISSEMVKSGRSALPEFERTRSTVDVSAFDDDLDDDDLE